MISSKHYKGGLRVSAKPPQLDVWVRIEGRLGHYARSLAPLSRKVLKSLLANLGCSEDVELSLLLCDGPTMRNLNRRWRDIEKPTNVLSFPSEQVTEGEMPRNRVWGDIVICLPYMNREARQLGISPSRHLSHLLVHGLLHLIGYDHRDDDEAARMEALEQRLLEPIGDHG